MKRILIVEDDEPFRRMLCLTLQKYGYDVVEVTNGREALELHAVEPVDVVVTDLIMPDKEGLETIRDFRRTEPVVPVIAMSGGGRIDAGDFLRIAKFLGAAHTFTKPFSIHELRLAIEDVLDRATGATDCPR